MKSSNQILSSTQGMDSEIDAHCAVIFQKQDINFRVAVMYQSAVLPRITNKLQRGSSFLVTYDSSICILPIVRLSLAVMVRSAVGG